ncbi:MAG: hypothetical protein WAU88_06535 [Candidatus Zixiibacteriota bacterium]
MPSSIKSYLVLLILTCLAAFSCTPDMIVPPPINLTDQYTGTYTRQVEDTDSSVVVPILWQFSSNQFSMALDRAHYASKDSLWVPEAFLLCNWQGEYKIETGTVSVLPPSESKDSSRTVRTCDGPYAPYGLYQFVQSVSGELTMTSLTQNPQGENVIRTINLIKKQ